MISFSEFYYLFRVDQVVVRVPVMEVPEASLLNEGQWVESGKKDWMIRVDAADPAIPSQRHVHIARKKHTAAKNQQASWNEDKTRHDKGTFNASVGSLKVVQNLARTALSLPPTAVLEHTASSRTLLMESSDPFALCIVYLSIVGAPQDARPNV